MKNYHHFKNISEKKFRNYISYLFFSFLLISLFNCGGDWKGFTYSTGVHINSQGGATLTWQPPASNIDGTPANDIAGYIIYYGRVSSEYTNWIDVGNVTSYIIHDLPKGVFYFVITSYDKSGNESDFSNELSKYIE